MKLEKNKIAKKLCMDWAIGTIDTKQLLETLAFDTFNDTSSKEWLLAKEAKTLWESYVSGEVSFDTPVTSYNAPQLNIEREVTICPECRGKGLIQDPYWESIRVYTKCPSCSQN